MEPYSEESSQIPSSTIGIRTVIAILLFAVFVYCDREHITFHHYSTKDVISQIEWNPLTINNLSLKELSRTVHIF